VGEIVSPSLDDNGVAAALSFARRSEHRLVYWATEPTRRLPGSTPADGPSAISDRVLYSTDRISELGKPEAFPADSELRITACPQGPADQSLQELAVLAGTHSRFHVDPRIPVDRFESLYRIWVDRSTRRELADIVFVATSSGCVREKVGFITVQKTGDSGKIGLIAVHPRHRGRGIGSLLMGKAHEWMREHGLCRAGVVTQTGNIPACRLYARCGYMPVNVQAWFHFWLDPPADGSDCPRRAPAAAEGVCAP
jgi:GNAT superfamily N-acetyltransferase